MSVIDPVVHAALLVVFTWLVNLLFAALGLNLGNDVAQALAQVIVSYILSLFGYALYKAAFFNRNRAGVAGTEYVYHPPFS